MDALICKGVDKIHYIKRHSHHLTDKVSMMYKVMNDFVNIKHSIFNHCTLVMLSLLDTATTRGDTKQLVREKEKKKKKGKRRINSPLTSFQVSD